MEYHPETEALRRRAPANVQRVVREFVVAVATQSPIAGDFGRSGVGRWAQTRPRLSSMILFGALERIFEGLIAKVFWQSVCRFQRTLTNRILRTDANKTNCPRTHIFNFCFVKARAERCSGACVGRPRRIRASRTIDRFSAARTIFGDSARSI